VIAQIVRTVQKATCGDLKNFKRSGAVCEPLPVKRTAKNIKFSRPAANAAGRGDCQQSGKFSALERKGVRGKPKKGVLRH